MGRAKEMYRHLLNGKVVWQRSMCSGVQRWNELLNPAIKQDIEAFWKDKVNDDKFRQEDERRQKYYVLSMFPYPSGKLHMGHVRVYTISDTMARFHRMTGKNVLHPMGWDAFGLPAENAAIANGVEPGVWTMQNVAQMKSQLTKLGCNFDWDRELATCYPSYYRWTQFLFLKMYDAGLVYQKESLVNWDPVDATVLADEQVDEQGCSWRSGAKVEKKLLKQWYIRTTQFAKSLCEGLSSPEMQSWRDIVNLQRHWIGECSGTCFDFELVSEVEDNDGERTVSVWTAVPESVFRASFVAVKSGSVVDRLYSESGSESSSGIRKLSVCARNPFTGRLLPVYVTDDLVEYASMTDAHMGVPCLSENDAAFAVQVGVEVVTDENGTVDRESALRIAREEGFGGFAVSSKLRDWLISRQRYWGTPIPMVQCPDCGPQPVAYSDLPVTLPHLVGQSLKDVDYWLHTKCSRCGGEATRETDTMDTFMDSSWYFLRFLDPGNVDLPFSPRKVSKFMPVDLYIGGKEHAVLHLYYARFFNHFLHSIGLVPTSEPFRKLLVQGMIMGKTYRVKDTGKYLKECDVDVSDKSGPVEKMTGLPVVSAWEKMSKSKHNGVEPESMLAEYGVDTTRLLILADVAPTSNRNWSDTTFSGVLNWQRRLWKVMQKFLEVRSQLKVEDTRQIPSSEDFERQEANLLDRRNFYLKAITFNYFETYQLSVAITKMQGLTKVLNQASTEVYGWGPQFERALATQLVTLAPMAPHFASELWAGLVSAPHRVDTVSDEIDWNRPVLSQRWPEVDPEYCLDLLCKVNGVEVCTVKLPRYELDQLTHDDALELALSESKLQQSTVGHKIVNTRFVLYQSYRAAISVTTVKSGSHRAVKEV